MIDIHAQLRSAQDSSADVRRLTADQKSTLLYSIADEVLNDADLIIEINSTEVENARRNSMEESALDRLALDHQRIKSMVQATKQVADLDEVVGEVLDSFTGASGIQIKKVRVPLGVVAVIYENRPNVTMDSAAIALKSSNAVVLRGSSSALQTNKAIVAAIHRALDVQNLARSAVTFIQDSTRDGAKELMQARGLIDVLIPRGGESLINAIYEDAKVPYIIDGAGNCHVYVDKDADLDMAEKIVLNSKIQRPSVCNSAESLVVHRDVAKEFIERISKAFSKKNVAMVGDSCSVDFGAGNITLGTESDFGQEFLDLKISIAVVETLDGAINHVNKYSTGHSESIITDNPDSASRFMNEVTSAVVMHNTSTRFTDGERFGFGAEIGISTQKLHARGPMALRELTTYQYRVHSDGATV